MAARKNYSFEKNQRAKAKAAKREEKAAARAEKKRKAEQEDGVVVHEAPEDGAGESANTD